MIYNPGAIFPIFEMNIPEGFVRRHIPQRLQRSVGTVTDMMFLALRQDTGIGALSYVSELNLERPKPENLADLIKWDDKSSVFEYLLDKYLLNTSVSGVQPKVMLNADTKGLVLFLSKVLGVMAEKIMDFIRLNDLHGLFPQLAQAVEQGVTRSMSTNNVFVRFDVKRTKRRKSERQL